MEARLRSDGGTYHEEGVVGTSANDADLDAVPGIPLFLSLVPEGGGMMVLERTHASIAVKDVDVVAGVQVINSTFTVDFESI